MRYLPYERLEGRPNVIVDGYATEGTLIALTHWKGGGTPPELRDDLSTQIVFRYLDRPELHVRAETVSNNHFDEDGLCGIFAVMRPDEALARRALLCEVAEAGDFSTYRNREAARITLALLAFQDPDTSPLGADALARPYPEVSAALYEEGLARLPEMLDDPGRFRALWEAPDALLAESEKALAAGAISLEERPDLDLAVLTIGDGAPEGGSWLGLHEMAVCNATSRHRVMLVRGARAVVRFRYETWVDYASRPTVPRVDLAPLAEELSAQEPVGRWTFDGVDSIVPALRLDGGAESAIPPERLRAAVISFLERAATAPAR